MNAWVMPFDQGGADQRDLLGGKGANLAEMTRIGLPVPPGFTVTTEACGDFFANDQREPAGLWDQVVEAVHGIEQATGRCFGHPANPLLLSVRSGAKFSMPGMMDTILNLGMTPETLCGFGRVAGDRFVHDAYRRLLHMFGHVALGISDDPFEAALSGVRERVGAVTDQDLEVEDLRGVIAAYRRVIADAGQTFPDDPWEQLHVAVLAVFRSWNTERAIAYRTSEGIPHDLWTAANVQAMVFGNLGETSATGVAFTRNPATGERALYGEYLTNAQGEDIVAGIRTPRPVSELAADPAFGANASELDRISEVLEKHYRDMQDVEFTIEQGKLWMLQTRTGKRTADAAVRIAVDMADEGLIDQREAVLRVTPRQIERLLHPRIDSHGTYDVLAVGLPASPGAATGTVVFNSADAVEMTRLGQRVLLVRAETSADDFPGLAAAQGVLTARGGMTSHAAVVARGMGKPAVTGCTDLEIVEEHGQFRVGERVVRAGDLLSIDGATGRVIMGAAATRAPDLDEPHLRTLLEWADGFRRMGVRANADTPADAERAREFGAAGIGLCRTEHMFFGEDRLPLIRAMILARDDDARQFALDQLELHQRADFRTMLTAMAGQPVVIRTLDPPLHEFLPTDEHEISALAFAIGEPFDDVRERIETMRESNPMLGLRGCRVGVIWPEVTRMQARAIYAAAIDCLESGVQAMPEVMIPLVGTPEELRLQRKVVETAAESVFAERGRRIPVIVGTMIEVPRAALLAGEIAAHAHFFSFGTNDLTQLTMGLSRDDSGRFLPQYVEDGVLVGDPFASIDVPGVGELVRMAAERGRAARPDLELGVCGEHGGDPASIGFFHEIGLDYVSCSPFRLPVARLAAAHAALGQIERDV
jgi:pyruvate, orthophosphate dikinase